MRKRTVDKTGVLLVLTNCIYKNLYGTDDNRTFRMEMKEEIEEWLYEGDYPEVTSIEELSSSFHDYWINCEGEMI